jgi:hypothetical protein
MATVSMKNTFSLNNMENIGVEEINIRNIAWGSRDRESIMKHDATMNEFTTHFFRFCLIM